MDNEKRKTVHKMKGSRVLDDPFAEQVAYLLGEGTPEPDILQLLGTTADKIKALKPDPAFKRRVEYLVRYFTRKHRKIEAPKNLDEYQDFALKELWRTIRKASDPKVKVDGCKALAVAVKTLRRERPDEPASPVDDSLISQLTESFNKDSPDGQND